MATYREIMTTPGRQIRKRVYYLDEQEYQVYLDDEIFKSAKLQFNTSVTDGTACWALELETTEPIDKDKVIYFVVEASYDGETQTKTWGDFYLLEEPTYKADTKTYVHQYYDRLLTTMVLYEPVNVNYPISCQDFFEEVVSDAGLTTNITLSVTGSMQLATDPYYNISANKGMDYTYRDVINDILQVNGVLAKVNWNGQLLSVGITGGDSIDDDILKNKNIEVNSKNGPINKLTLTRANNTDNISYEDTASISQYGVHEVVIHDNVLLGGSEREDYIQALSAKYFGDAEYIYDCELTGVGGFEIGESIFIETNGESYYSRVWNNEIEFTDGLEESIYYGDIDAPTEYSYTSGEEKADKTAEIIIDKKIGEVDITGKTIEMTAKDIKINSTNFKVDNLGNVVCNSATMKDATINGGNVELHDLGKDERASLIIKKDIATYTPVVGQSQSIYSIPLENPNAYMGSGATQETEFLQFTRGSGDDIETRTYTYVYEDGIEWIREHIYNPNPNNYWNLENFIWIYDGNVIQFIQPYSFQTRPSYLTFTKYDTTIPATQYFKFVNQIEGGTTQLTANTIQSTGLYLKSNESPNDGIDIATLGLINNKILNSIYFKNEGSTDSAQFVSRTDNISTTPLPLSIILTRNGWSRDILKNQILWGNGPNDNPVFLNGSQTVNLAHNISEQPHGIVIVWSAYSSGAQNYNWHCDFIPKQFVQLNNGGGYTCIMASSKFENMATKYIYIYDDRITGHADNNSSSTTPSTAGVKYSNTAYVIRYVIGV